MWRGLWSFVLGPWPVLWSLVRPMVQGSLITQTEQGRGTDASGLAAPLVTRPRPENENWAGTDARGTMAVARACHWSRSSGALNTSTSFHDQRWGNVGKPSVLERRIRAVCTFVSVNRKIVLPVRESADGTARNAADSIATRWYALCT